jgi:ELWxxDGT repeat protein
MSGQELWRTDGTAAGTSMVADLNPGFLSSNPSGLTVVGSALYFIGQDGNGHSQLWLYTGSGTPTEVTTGAAFAASGANPVNLTAAGSTLYFGADDASGHRQLWQYAGSGSPTQVNTGPTSANVGTHPNELKAAGTTLYFAGFDAGVRAQLYQYGGSGIATALTNSNAFYLFGANPSQLTVVGSSLYFAAWDYAGHRQLWQNGGSGSPTPVTAGAAFSPNGATPDGLTAVGSTLYFSAYDASGRAQLWQYGGSGSPNLVTTGDAFWARGAFPSGLTAVNSTLYFLAYDASGHRQLWQYTGTGSPTQVNPGPTLDVSGTYAPNQLTAVGALLYFGADDTSGQPQLWRYYGSGSPVQVVINPGGASSPLSLSAIGNTLYLSANDGSRGSEPWLVWQGIAAAEGQALTSVRLATFGDPGSDGTTADYSGTIVWGDGNSTPFDSQSVVKNPDGTFSVLGSHTYVEGGTFSYAVTLRDVGGSTLALTGTARVDDVPPAASITGPTDGYKGVQGQVRTFNLGVNNPESPDNQAGFTYTINWGDGTDAKPDVQVISPTANNGSGIKVSHTYLAAGTDTVTVTATDDDGNAGPAATLPLTILAAEQQGNTLVVAGTPGNDSFTFTPRTDGGMDITAPNLATTAFYPAGTILVLGYGGSNSVTLNGTAGDDTFTLGNGTVAFSSTTAGVQLETITLSSIQAITVNGQAGNDTYQITGKGIPATLNAGGGNNTFKFADGATLRGAIVGGAGSNTLDYSAYTRGRTITLTMPGLTPGSSNGTEASLSGGFQNITAVVGSASTTSFDTLTGPNAASTWNLTGANAGSVNGLSFSGIENLTGGTHADTFLVGPGASLAGRLDGGNNFPGATDTLNFSGASTGRQLTLSQDGTYHGVQGSDTDAQGFNPVIAGGFDNIDSLIGNAGSSLGTGTAGFVGSFDQTLTLSGFASAALDVQDDFNGSLLASTLGTVAQPIQRITTGGSLAGSARIKIGYLNTLTVTGDLAGTVYGYGSGGDGQTTFTITNVNVGGNWSGTVVAPTIGYVNQTPAQQSQPYFSGQLAETTPAADLRVLNVAGTVTGTARISAGVIQSMHVGQDLAGQVSVAGALGTLSVGGSLSGSVSAATIGTVSVGQDLTGQVNAQTLGSVSVSGNTSGTVQASNLTTLSSAHARGPLLLRVVQNGVERRLEAAPVGSATLANLVFSYVYDATGTGDPRVTARILANPDGATFDLAAVASSPTAKFDLAGLDDPSGQAAGLHDLTLDGDLAAEAVQLPLDHLASVSVRDTAWAGAVRAASVEAVAFGSVVRQDGQTIAAGSAHAGDAAQVLATGTAVVQANDTFRVDFGSAQPTTFFLDTDRSGRLDDKDILFTDQATNPAAGTATARLAVTVPSPTGQPGNQSVVQTISLIGSGGAIQTRQLIGQAITSTGPLGDLILGAPQGIVANVTAPSILGSIDATSGPITGTIQTTTGDLGRVLTDAAGQVIGTTVVHAASGIGGRLISRGRLVSQVLADGGISGVIAAQGDLGVRIGSSRLGGIVANGGLSGQVVTLGALVGDVTINGGLHGGRMIARGGILGNLTVNGGLDAAAAVVSAGIIGDPAAGTAFILNGDNKGIIAAEGAIRFGMKAPQGAVYNDVGAVPGSPNAAAMDAIFTNNGQPLEFDISGLDLAGLNLILADLLALKVGADGNLTGPVA